MDEPEAGPSVSASESKAGSNALTQAASVSVFEKRPCGWRGPGRRVRMESWSERLW